MNYLEKIKLIVELITSTATALILLKQLGKFYNPIKKFIKITIPEFLKGYTDINGKKVCFFKGLKLRHEREIAIINAISKKFEMEDILVLDKDKLLDIISKSDAFYTIRQRKK